MHLFFRVFNESRNEFCTMHARSYDKALYPLEYYRREFQQFNYSLRPCPFDYTGSAPLD